MISCDIFHQFIWSLFFRNVNTILKRSRDFLLYTKKETNCALSTVNIWLLPQTTSPSSRSVHVTFTVRVTKQHPVNISFLKNLVQRIIEAQLILRS